MENNRRSGRTTQIIERALSFAKSGERVLIAFPTVEMAKHAYQNLPDNDFVYSDTKMVILPNLETQGSLKFIGAEMLGDQDLYHGYRLFFDHTVSEMDGVKIGRR